MCCDSFLSLSAQPAQFFHPFCELHPTTSQQKSPSNARILKLCEDCLRFWALLPFLSQTTKPVLTQDTSSNMSKHKTLISAIMDIQIKNILSLPLSSGLFQTHKWIHANTFLYSKHRILCLARGRPWRQQHSQVLSAFTPTG